jgi:outer membrane protein assembly factor BamB
MNLSRFSTLFRICCVIFLTSAGSSWAGGPEIADRYPIQEPPQLSAPIVEGPIHECALFVRVSGFIPEAIVTVFAGGAQVGKDTPKHGSADIKLDRPLVLNESITAVQIVGGVISEKSYDAVTVTAYPNLTKPVAIPEVYECGRVVPVGNLIASTHVDVWDTVAPPPASIGNGETTGNWQPISTNSLEKDHSVRAQQTACPAVPTKTAVSQPSEPLKVKQAPNPPPSPFLTPPQHPVIGTRQLTAHGLLVGSHVQIDYDNTGVAGGFSNAAENLVDVPPVPPGVGVTVSQTLCTESAPSPPITATDEVPTPIIGGPICAGSHYVMVDNTTPGATVVLLRGGAQIGNGGGTVGTLKTSVGQGMTLQDGDALTAVQYVKSSFGTFYSAPSNTVTVGCRPSGDVVTQHNDNQRTGVYSAETTLTPALVLRRGMRVKYKHLIDGWVNAQPLYVRQVEFPDRPANGLFVATFFKNKVYALDADTGDEKWVVTLRDSEPDKRGKIFGVDSTPVIDVPNHRIYVAFATMNQDVVQADGPDSAHPLPPKPNGEPNRYQDTDLKDLDLAFWIVALDYRTGKEVARTKVDSSMYRANGEAVTFEARFHRNHSALLLDHGALYVAFGSIAPNECFLNFHGWVMAYRAHDLSFQTAFITSKNFNPHREPYACDHPNDAAGIWQGGGGLTADRDGNVYFLSGDGKADPNNDQFGDSFIKLTPTGSLLVPSVFVPSNADTMAKHDADFGAGGALSIPGTDLIIGGGKPGYLYLLDAKSMRLGQTITASTNQYDPSKRDDSWNLGPHLHGSPTYWRPEGSRVGHIYTWGEKDYLRLYHFQTWSGHVEEPANLQGAVKALQSTMPGGIISISSNGDRPGTGIVWATLPSEFKDRGPLPGRLYAFDAESLKPLWDAGFDTLGHWLPPTIADGKVFIGTSSNFLICYELDTAPGVERDAWIPFTPRESLEARSMMAAQSSVADMKGPPINTLLALTPPAPAILQAQVVGEGAATFSIKLDPVGQKRSWEGAGTSLLGDVILARKPFPEEGKIEIKMSPQLIWTASDGSVAETRLVKSFAAPKRGDEDWGLYEVTRTTGKGVLSGISFIQRLYTGGGRAPASEPYSELDTLRVPFQAQYVLYR